MTIQELEANSLDHKAVEMALTAAPKGFFRSCGATAPPNQLFLTHSR
jgi:hypothetical protein